MNNVCFYYFIAVVLSMNMKYMCMEKLVNGFILLLLHTLIICYKVSSSCSLLCLSYIYCKNYNN